MWLLWQAIFIVSAFCIAVVILAILPNKKPAEGEEAEAKEEEQKES